MEVSTAVAGAEGSEPSGYPLAPSEVEAVLLAHPAIADVAVVGLPSPSGGEDVTAVVVLATGAVINPVEVRHWAKSRLSAYEVPRRIDVVEELPRNIVGKVLRRVVRQQLLER